MIRVGFPNLYTELHPRLMQHTKPKRNDVHMTSALRGRKGVRQILTKGREVA